MPWGIHYRFRTKDYPIGQIVEVDRMDEYGDKEWHYVGSYFSMKKRLPRGVCYNAGINWQYDRFR